MCLACLGLLLAACGGGRVPAGPPVIATYPIAAFDPATGGLGVAVESRLFGVGVPQGQET